MNHEEAARMNHRCGCNCAQSVFCAFAQRMGLTEAEALAQAPKPRSDGGRCGAFLAGLAVLQRLDPAAAPAFEEAFLRLNGAQKCGQLIAAHGRLHKGCNDYVGDAARLLDEAMG